MGCNFWLIFGVVLVVELVLYALMDRIKGEKMKKDHLFFYRMGISKGIEMEKGKNKKGGE